MDTTEDLLTRGVENIIPDREKLRTLLASGKKLNIYLGIDPTATHIHVGHAVPLRKLQRFAELGHNVTFLIGDFTALIGDTSDKDTERPVLTSEQIEENFKTYKAQAEKIIDFSLVRVRHNSEWLRDLSFADIVKLCQHFSAGEFVGRELIKKRLAEGRHVGLHELLYPVMQGYDSYTMDTDIQLGGTDQTFNMQAGRTLQHDLRGKESFVMANRFLMGTDGRKMSKSWGNAIWLDEAPEDMYGKVMSLQDALIADYFLLATNASSADVDAVTRRLEAGENPMTLKKELAHRMVSELASPEEADRAAEAFSKKFQERDLTTADLPVFSTDVVAWQPVDLLVTSNLTESKSEARRLIAQGGVEVDGVRIAPTAETVSLKDGSVIRAGKKRFLRIKLTR